MFLSILIGCSSEQSQDIKPAILKDPILKINIAVSGDPKLIKNVNLPLLLWSSFEYKDINRTGQGGHTKQGKATFCVIAETDGIQAQPKTSIEFIEDAKCLYTHFTSNEGVPHQYMIGLIKIKIPETGEEVWTWRTAVEITK